MAREDYVHGYSTKEAKRLGDQAVTLAELLHHDSIFEPGSKILEAGCGIGAQTVILAGKNPQCDFLSIDISEESLAKAKESVRQAGLTNVEFAQADILKMDFGQHSFDHVFVCFVLEHLSNPEEVLLILKKLIKPGGSITAIEGDHGSTYFYPNSSFAHQAIQCLIELQAQAGGDSLIGRRLYPLLTSCGFKDVTVTPRVVYADSSRPEMVEGFTKNTFNAMVEGIRDQAIGSGMIDEETFDKGVKDLYRAAESDGTFNYTFFKAVGIN
jgi:ubiquinone/menaquinone biosynthesis C-methylase UbiE